MISTDAPLFLSFGSLNTTTRCDMLPNAINKQHRHVTPPLNLTPYSLINQRFEKTNNSTIIILLYYYRVVNVWACEHVASTIYPFQTLQQQDHLYFTGKQQWQIFVWLMALTLLWLADRWKCSKRFLITTVSLLVVLIMLLAYICEIKGVVCDTVTSPKRMRV